MAMPAESNPPREHRRRVLKGASILSGITNSVIYCTIRNMHENGAELIVPVEARVPASSCFMCRPMPSATARPCAGASLTVAA